jgi:hypothetical protein
MLLLILIRKTQDEYWYHNKSSGDKRFCSLNSRGDNNNILCYSTNSSVMLVGVLGKSDVSPLLDPNLTYLVPTEIIFLQRKKQYILEVYLGESVLLTPNSGFIFTKRFERVLVSKIITKMNY